jgi:hypothetical protein
MNDIELLDDHAVMTVRSRKYGAFKVLISLEDVSLVQTRLWGVARTVARLGMPSAFRVVSSQGGEVTYLARFLCGLVPNDGKKVSHRNKGDNFDNRREYLVVTSQRGNMSNDKEGSPTKGCYLDKRRGRWSADVKVNGRKVHLGSFKTAPEARAAYLAATNPLVGADHVRLGLPAPVEGGTCGV